MKAARSARDTILRQPLTNRISHWLIALSTFALIVSGLGQMPMYQRYKIAELPGMAWAADFGVTLWLHYIAAAVLIFAVVYHLVYAVLTRRFAIMPRKGDMKESAKIIAAMLGKGEEPDSHKYLAEQRIAYAFIGVNTLVVILSGIIKVYKNLPAIQLDPALISLTTLAHNVSALLLTIGIVGHLAAFIFKVNRKLVPAMFSGRVDREYARTRHSLWYAEHDEREQPLSEELDRAA